jgi:hypothetical protein
MLSWMNPLLNHIFLVCFAQETAATTFVRAGVQTALTLDSPTAARYLLPTVIRRLRQFDSLVDVGFVMIVLIININRLLRWEAGWAKEYGLTWNEALASVTKWPADMMNLSNNGRIAVGQKADFFFYNGDPLGLQAEPILGAVGSYIHCKPTQPTE